MVYRYIPGIHHINHGSYVICHDDDITLYKAQVVYSAYPSKWSGAGLRDYLIPRLAPERE